MNDLCTFCFEKCSCWSNLYFLVSCFRLKRIGEIHESEVWEAFTRWSHHFYWIGNNFFIYFIVAVVRQVVVNPRQAKKSSKRMQQRPWLWALGVAGSCCWNPGSTWSEARNISWLLSPRRRLIICNIIRHHQRIIFSIRILMPPSSLVHRHLRPRRVLRHRSNSNSNRDPLSLKTQPLTLMYR